MADDDTSFDSIFCGAIEIASSDDRAAFIARACGSDDGLRHRIERLVHAHYQAGSFLEGPPAPATLAAGSDPRADVGSTVIGPYKLLQPIGEGGMGTVYLAEQTHPVRRTVALKLIKAGMDSRQVLARFGAERQALALMDHPNIAKVFDAGTTESGRPYFVMELVKGIPITRFCDERRLTLRERLELAIPVCQAVQHAHQKGIIHRDLKPSNVLIALYDGKPVPKIIDFGVAKATGPRLTDQTLYTEFGAVVGTLEYMSPEQAELNQLDIDTRSDIYSLGVLLYELLTGSTPLERKRLKAVLFLEVLRLIREEESPRPSLRLSTTDELPAIAACRHVEPRKLSGLVRGELDWIVMKALEKVRTRRYETASGLAADLRRYLDDEPVQACPPSGWYRFRKFGRRNKVALSAAGLISLAMLAAVGLLAVSNVLITHEKDQKATALDRARESAKAATDQKLIAEEHRGIALANERTAQEQETIARHRFYAAQTNLAMQAWEAGQPARVLELLESLRPKFDEEDLRGFEWYYLWRLCHAGFLSTLRGHTSPVWGVAFSVDGKTLASISIGNEGSAGHHSDVKLWDIAAGRERITFEKNGLHPFRALAFSPGDKALATCGINLPTSLWDPTSGQAVVSFNRPSHCVAFFPDGKTLVTQKPPAGSAVNDLELWDAVTGQQKAVLRLSPGEVIGNLAVAPDGQSVAAGTSLHAVRLWRWDGTRWQDRASFQGHHWCPSVTFSPDSQTLVAGEAFVKSYDLDSGKEKVSFQGHVGAARGLAFSPDGKILASGGMDRTVRTWEAATGKELTCRPHAGPVIALAISHDGKTMAVGCGDTTISLWELSPAPADTILAHGGHVYSLAFTPDGKKLVSSGLAPTKYWDVATGEQCVAAPMEWAKSLKGEDISPDAKTQAFQSYDRDGAVTLCNLATGRPEVVLRGHTSEIFGLAYSSDGKTVATAGFDGTARLWDIATGQTRAIIRPMLTGTLPVDWVSAVAFSPDGTLLATGTKFQIVTLWEVATARERLALQTGERVGTGSDVLSVVFSPNGKILAVSSGEGIVRLWDVATGASRGSFRGHTDKIQILAFSPDGNTLVTGGADKTAKLWDVPTRQERLTLKGHRDYVMALAFAPDGRTLATGSLDSTVRIWHTSQHPEATAYNNEEDPDDPETAQGLNTAGERLWSLGRTEESEKAYRKALTRARKLTNAFPGNSGYRYELARSWLSLGLLLFAGERTREAEQARREAAQLVRILATKDKQSLAFHFGELAELLQASGHVDQAVAAAHQSVELAPENSAIWHNRARINLRLGRTSEALEDYSKVAALCPREPTFQINVAWILATCADPKLRDPHKAVGLAKRAIELDATQGLFWNTLGVAQYRSGEWKAAADALTRSMELRNGGNGNDWFFLAMAHWQLGDKPQARSWYDKAVAWMEKNQPNNEELIRFRAEAAELLGVKDK